MLPCGAEDAGKYEGKAGRILSKKTPEKPIK
jgi:hypothetical protein